MKNLRVAMAFMTMLSAWSPSEAQDVKTDVALSWQKGLAYVPGKVLTTTPPNISTEKPFPVVLYLHGCVGIEVNDRWWAHYLKELGFIVIQPNSLERDRPTSCDPASYKSNLFPGARAFRLPEIDYAREQISKSAWADQKNIFLMGFSEGGHVASLASRADFRGVVIMGWHCGIWGTLNTPDGIPVLAIDHESDPWFPGIAGGRCGTLFGNRPHSKMITLPGHGHSTVGAPAREGVAAFFKDLMARP